MSKYVQSKSHLFNILGKRKDLVISTKDREVIAKLYDSSINLSEVLVKPVADVISTAVRFTEGTLGDILLSIQEDILNISVGNIENLNLLETIEGCTHHLQDFSEAFQDYLLSLKAKSGVYFLFDKEDTLLYVGKSINLLSRVPHSAKSKVGTTKVHIEALTNVADTHILEMYYINLLKPPLNAQDKSGDLPTCMTVAVPTYDFIEVY